MYCSATTFVRFDGVVLSLLAFGPALHVSHDIAGLALGDEPLLIWSGAVHRRIVCPHSYRGGNHRGVHQATATEPGLLAVSACASPSALSASDNSPWTPEVIPVQELSIFSALF